MVSRRPIHRGRKQRERSITPSWLLVMSSRAGPTKKGAGKRNNGEKKGRRQSRHKAHSKEEEEEDEEATRRNKTVSWAHPHHVCRLPAVSVPHVFVDPLFGGDLLTRLLGVSNLAGLPCHKISCPICSPIAGKTGKRGIGINPCPPIPCDVLTSTFLARFAFESRPLFPEPALPKRSFGFLWDMPSLFTTDKLGSHNGQSQTREPSD